MPYLDEAGLAYYDPKLKEWIASQPVRTVPSTFYPWMLTSKAGAAACWPVGGTPLLPTVDFLFTETGPASGDKGPENPSTITGVSSVTVTRCGKNLLSTPYAQGPSYTFHGFTATENSDGSITWSGTTDNIGSCHFRLNDLYSFRLCAGVAYTASLTGSANQNIRLQAFNSAGQIAFTAYSGGSPVTVVVNEDSYVTLRVSAAKEAGTLDNVTVYPQLELGITATSFEPYEGTDYTINLNDTYYGGTIDLATGLMTVTRKLEQVSAFNIVSNVGDSVVKFRFVSQENYIAGNTSENLTSNRFVVNSLDREYQSFRTVGAAGTSTNAFNFTLFKSNLDVSTAADPSNPTNAEWLAAGNAWLVSNSTYFVCRLYTPLAVQLTPTQILSLAQSDKYTPRINTVYTDASSVQVGYIKSPIRDEYELTQAIVAQGGNI